MAAPPPPRPEHFSYTTESYTRNVAGAGSSDDDKAAHGYAAMALAHAALAMPLLAQPREAARFLLGGVALPPNVEHDRLMGLLAAGLLSGAATAWTLKGAAEERRLDSSQAERLQLGLMALGAASLGVQMAHGADLTKNGAVAGAGIAALTLAVPAARLLASKPARRRLGDRVKGMFDGVGRLFDFRGGFKLSSALYAVLTPAFFLAGASYLLSPQKTLGNLLGYVLKGNDSIFLWRQAGGALLTLLPAVTYTLKEKADAHELDSRAARTLNLGLLLSSLGHLTVLAPIANDGTGGRYFPVLLGTWATAFAASAVGLASAASERRL